jgi:hypothetical protein
MVATKVMVRCQYCRKRIKNVQLDKVFKITLGNFKRGVFYGYRTLYYHQHELVSPSSILVK